MLPPLPCGSLPSSSAASSPEKKPPQQHNKAAQNLLFKWRQSRLRKESNEETVVMLDDDHLSGETSKPQPPWINNGVVTLSMADKAILEGKEWLTDSIVNAAQTMLADQFSMTTGFQSTNTGLCMTFTIEPDEFVQILHDGLQSLLSVVSTQKSRYSTASIAPYHLPCCSASYQRTQDFRPFYGRTDASRG